MAQGEMSVDDIPVLTKYLYHRIHKKVLSLYHGKKEYTI